MKPILELKSIGKQYKIGGKPKGYLSLREQLSQGVSFKKKSKNTFWALEDISFDVMPGESIGIIGRNGAGKSTLLKVLSRITPPTKGIIRARGRVASLLEVGTGFHPELTGKENIYLNGSILGLTKSDINRQYDAIVDFSGVEKFLETPLKHYSSGMQLRLAFAVAAHLEPEILVIDEVLAVGDAEFQKKCIGKMSDVSKSGRTILFVSHNMTAVNQLCTRGIFLQQGKLVKDGPASEIVQYYLNDILSKENYYLDKANYRKYNEDLTIRDIQFKDKKLTIKLHGNKPFEGVSVACSIKTLDNLIIFKTSSAPIWGQKTFDINGEKVIQLDLSQLHLVTGSYLIGLDLAIPNKEYLVRLDEAISLDVHPSTFYEGNKSLRSGVDGYLMVEHNWSELN